MTADEWLAANPTATLREAFEAGGLSPTARGVRHLRLQGIGPREIARRMSIHEGRVQNHLNRAGMTKPPSGRTPKLLRDHLAAHGPQTRAAVAAALGPSAASTLGNVAGIYVLRWIETGARPAALYALGDCEDALKPPTKPRHRSAGVTLQNVWLSAAR